jgi:hypothetical protein
VESNEDSREYDKDYEDRLILKRGMLAQMDDEDLFDMALQMQTIIDERNCHSRSPAGLYNLTDGDPEVSNASEETTIPAARNSKTLQLIQHRLLSLDMERILNNTRPWSAVAEVARNICSCMSREIWPGKAMQQFVPSAAMFLPKAGCY